MTIANERSLVCVVTNGLMSAIIDGRYGEILPPQDVLAREFGVSRNVMREALSTLLRRHMLDMRPKTGTRVRPSSDWLIIDGDVVNWRFRSKTENEFLRDLIAFQAIIEPEAAASAAVRASADDIRLIRESFEKLQLLPFEDVGLVDAEVLLRSCILSASHNQFFKQTAPVMRCAVSLAYSTLATQAVKRKRNINLYEKAVIAIESQQPQNAKIAIREIFEADSNC